MISEEDEVFLAQNLKGLMLTCITQLNLELAELRKESQYRSIREGDLRIFAQLRGRRMSMSQLANELGMSRQGAQQSIKRLVQNNMVQLIMGRDEREKLVVITDKGHKFRQQTACQLRQQEALIARFIGEQAVADLKNTLSRIANNLVRSE